MRDYHLVKLHMKAQRQYAENERLATLVTDLSRRYQSARTAKQEVLMPKPVTALPKISMDIK